jgi:L-alanine-DL-glutamate epimerase-like enolase superfamily enzyme
MNTPMQGQSVHIVEARYRVIAPARLRRPFYDSTMGPFETFGISMLTLRDADGFEGEAPAGDIHVLESTLLPRLLSGQACDYSQMYRKLYWSIRNAGFRGPAARTLGSVDLALHDLAARRKRQPLHRFLGAERDWADAYASGGSTHLSERDLVEEMEGFARDGFQCVKMKVAKQFGSAMDEDVRRVRAVRAAIGPRVRLAVDANQAWNAEEATEFSRRIADQDIAWFEEPVHSADLNALRTYCGLGSIPAAVGESEACDKVFPSLVEAGAQHLQPTQLSSVADWLFVRDLAATHRLSFSSGGISHVSCQPVATAAETAQTEILFPLIETIDPLLSSGPKMSGGRFLLPDTPGLAMRIDWDGLEKSGRIAADRAWTAPSVTLAV